MKKIFLILFTLSFFLTEAQTFTSGIPKAFVESKERLIAFTGTKADFDGSEWIKKSGNKTSNGGSYAGTIIRVSSSIYWERQLDGYMTPEMFGALGDSITNDASAFQLTMDAQKINGVEIFCGKKYYKIGSTLTYNTTNYKQGLRIRGSGVQNTVFIFAFNNGTPLFSISGCETLTYEFGMNGSLSDFSIQTLAGYSDNTQGAAIQIVGNWYFSVKKILIKYIKGHGIYYPRRNDLDLNPDAYASIGNNIEDTEISFCSGVGINGLAGLGVSDLKVQRCRIGENKQGGIVSTGHQVWIVMNAIFSNGNSSTGYAGLYVKRVDTNINGLRVENNEFDNNKLNHILLEGVSDGIISSNRMNSWETVFNDASLSPNVHIAMKTVISGSQNLRITFLNNYHRSQYISTGSSANYALTLYDFNNSANNAYVKIINPLIPYSDNTPILTKYANYADINKVEIQEDNTYAEVLSQKYTTDNIQSLSSSGLNIKNSSGTTTARLFDTGNLTLGSSPTDNAYKLDVYGTGRFINGVNMATTSGNVSVGSGTATTKLHVFGSINSEAASGNILQLMNASDSNRSGYIEVVGDGDFSNRSVNFGASSGGYPLSFKNGNGTWMRISSTGLIGVGTLTPTHTFTIGSPNTGTANYNTVDQTINYERLRMFWGSNIFNISTEAGGTGMLRQLNLTGNSRTISVGGPNAFFEYPANTGGAINVSTHSGTSTASSSSINYINILPAINQSGTAGYRGLWISPYEQTTGSGSKLLIDVGTNSAAGASGTHTSKFSVDNLGNTFHEGKISVSTGSNKSTGTATLVAGTVTVSTTAVKTGSLVWVQYHGSAAMATSVLTVPTITDSTSFVITAITAGATTTNITDTNVVKWWIIN